jgi:ABC-type transport system substrate-binding protein
MPWPIQLPATSSQKVPTHPLRPLRRRTDRRRGSHDHFHLRGPDPDFLSNLTSIATTPVPAGTSFHDVGSTPIPGTGPYVIAAANKQRIRYVRNRRFREWSHAAQPNGNPDEIVMRYGLSPAQEVGAVERGQADWTADGGQCSTALRSHRAFWPLQ